MYFFGTSLILHHLNAVQQSEEIEERVSGVFHVESYKKSFIIWIHVTYLRILERLITDKG